MKTEQCFVCGNTYNSSQYEFYDMVKILKIYQVCDEVDICNKCGSKADKFVNYYGPKKQKDKLRVKNFLVSGVLPQRQFQAQMNGGYYEV